ncbi:MAG: SH3 domain-containing protein [Clostridia bacterium]|nr:SH3 domain-containing protein [Clostridia bacterium]
MKASVGRAYSVAKKLRLPVLMLAAIFLTVFVIGSSVIPRGAASDAVRNGINSNRFAVNYPAQTTQEKCLLDERDLASKPTTAPTLEEGETLSVGDNDAIIPEIVNMLASLGYIEADEPAEVFNEPMENAVKLFQRSNNMNQTGEVDNLMLDILYCGTPAEYVIEQGNSGDDVKMVQERLTDLGYYDEKVNGYYGTSTQTAIEDFQILNDLDVSGVVDSGTFSTLFSYEARACVEEPLPSEAEEAPAEVTAAEQPADNDRWDPDEISKTTAPSSVPRPTPAVTSTPAPTSEPFVTFNENGYTNATNFNFRSLPSTDSSIIAVLPYGTQVRIIARTSQWYRVMYAGHFGYIAIQYVTIDASPTAMPTDAPTTAPTQAPTAAPTAVPTQAPTATPKPTPTQTSVPTAVPTPTHEPFVDFMSDGYINRSYVNFRSQPSTESEIIYIFTYGTQVQVLAKTSEWYRVRYNGYIGYIASPYITLGVLATPTPVPTSVPTPTPTPKPTASPTPSVTQDPFTPYTATGYVNVGYVNFRTGPSTDYPVIAQLTYGTVVDVIATNGYWYRARCNGTVGYVSAQYITIGTAPTPTPQPTQPPTSGNIENFVSVLRAQLGKPYVGGTQGPNTFDCSGYVYYCLKLCGVNIGRLTAAGYAAYNGWTRVNSFSNLRRGDLMFFYSNDFSRINHAAVYLGNGQLIHCSFSAGQVVISNAYSNWYQNHFYCGRRVFNN